jgi:hypothetical protein
VLLEDILGLCSLVKVIEAKVNTASVVGNAIGEASILTDCQQDVRQEEEEDLQASSDAER